MRLILGPWTHGDRSLSYAGEVDFGPAAPVDGNLADDFFALRRRWFDRWVKGVDNGIDDGAAGARLCDGRRLGAAQPRRAGSIMAGIGAAPPSGRCRRPHGLASTCMPTAAFAAPSPARLGRRSTIRFDPRDPVPTIGGAISSGEPVMHGGAYDQREGPQVFGAREPYRRLPSAPTCCRSRRRRSTAISKSPGRSRCGCGSPPTAPDTDFTAKLIDVLPAERGLPARLRDEPDRGVVAGALSRQLGASRRRWSPGEVYAITIELFPIGNLFCAGHRLRLDISSSNFPHFDVNPNSGEPEGLDGASAHRRQPRLCRPRATLAHRFAGHSLIRRAYGSLALQRPAATDNLSRSGPRGGRCRGAFCFWRRHWPQLR